MPRKKAVQVIDVTAESKAPADAQNPPPAELQPVDIATDSAPPETAAELAGRIGLLLTTLADDEHLQAEIDAELAPILADKAILSQTRDVLGQPGIVDALVDATLRATTYACKLLKIPGPTPPAPAEAPRGQLVLQEVDDWSKIEPGTPVMSINGNWGIFCYSGGDKGIVIATWARDTPRVGPAVKKLVPGVNFRIAAPLG